MKIQIANFILTIEKKDVNTDIISELENDKGVIDMARIKKYNDVQDVARYVIEYCISKGTPITQIQLQKIMYYIQAAFLVERNQRCYDEEILNWEYGPVVRKVFDDFRSFGSREIDKVPLKVDIYIDDDFNTTYIKTEYNSNDISETDKSLINKVVEIYREVKPFELVDKTHNELPWKETTRNSVIPDDLIKEYYYDKKELLYGDSQ